MSSPYRDSILGRSDAHARYSHTTNLDEIHCCLDGFPTLDLTVRADAYKRPAAEVKSLATQRPDDAWPDDSWPDDSWSDIVVTIGVMFSTLVVSAMVLGFAASQVSVMMMQIIHHTQQLSLNRDQTPRAPRF